LLPAAFIELAEETGVIVAIGREMLRQACAAAQAWSRWMPAGTAPSVSVNLSVRQLQDPDLVGDVRQVLQESGLPASRLVLELTESILMADTDAATSTLARLKELGVRLALDDFGTGYSSLSYLERFPVDVLKIDKSFIDGLTTTDDGGPMVGAIIGLGQMLHLEITAEGIERPEQIDRLAALGCRLGQGYYFAKPLTGEAIALMVTGDPMGSAQDDGGESGRPALGAGAGDRSPV
jgi:EAL domain-containing protein (putative c-di-GMP-specific phosphodiesterase class I)